MGEISLGTQNFHERLAEQAAARVWYNHATRLGRWRVFVVAILPTCTGLAGAAWGLWWPAIAPEGLALLRALSALSGICLWLLDDLLWRPLIERTRRAAAVAQEMFDTALFRLPWNDLTSGPRHDSADIFAVGNPLVAAPAERARLEDWYRPELQGLPWYLGRLMAQRENLWWDRNLRKTYVWWAAAPTVLVILVPVAMLVRQGSLAECVLLLASVLPIVRAYSLIVRDNWAAIDRLQALLGHTTTLMDRYLTLAPTNDEARADARRVQDAIFRHRASAPVGLHRVYWTTRAANEAAYSDAIADVQRRLKVAATRADVRAREGGRD